MIDKEEVEFYRNAAKTDKSIHIFDLNEEEFLYLNWDEKKPPTAEELQALVRESKKRDVSGLEVPEDVKKAADDKGIAKEAETREKDTRESCKEQEAGSRENWDLSGSIADCIMRYARCLSSEELKGILNGVEEGLTEKQIKHLFTLHDLQQMERYRKIYAARNRQTAT